MGEMRALKDVRLCSECAYRRFIRDEGDGSPCGFYLNRTLKEARATCNGTAWLSFARTLLPGALDA